jgi:putative transposase
MSGGHLVRCQRHGQPKRRRCDTCHTRIRKTSCNIVFSTKDRRKSIRKEFQAKMGSYIAGICKNHDLHVHAINGMDDHVHLLVRLPQTMPLAKAVAVIKSNSSKWANEQGHKFAWQEGYAAFSVSASLVDAVSRYIRSQEMHHAKRTFDSELIALLKKHGVTYDPAFVFGWTLVCRTYGA